MPTRWIGWIQLIVATPRFWRWVVGVLERQRAVRLHRGQIPSPGRPTVAWRQDRVRFWEAIAAGAMTEDAAATAGVSSPVGFRWFGHAGGVNPRLPVNVSGRYLSSDEREDIALWRAKGAGVRDIARRLDRAPSTISRELRLNASTRTYGLDLRPRSRSGMPNGVLDAPRRPSWSPTTGCAATSRTSFLASYAAPMAKSSLVLPVGDGTGAINLTAGIGPGCRRGALNRSLAGCRWNPPMMRPCGSATKPSIRRYMSRPAGRSNGIWSVVCAVVARYGCRGHGPGRKRGRTSPRRR